jgi:hypothetical protein
VKSLARKPRLGAQREPCYQSNGEQNAFLIFESQNVEISKTCQTLESAYPFQFPNLYFEFIVYLWWGQWFRIRKNQPSDDSSRDLYFGATCISFRVLIA